MNKKSRFLFIHPSSLIPHPLSIPHPFVGTVLEKPQARVAAHLARARELQRNGGEIRAVVNELEAALTQARATPYEVEFRTRVELVLALAEAHLAADEIEKARRMIDEEEAFVEKIFQIMQATGT